jgi:hypothetical protein
MPRARSRRSLLGWRAAWGRWFVLFALVFALPATEHLLRELVSVACEVAGDDCADGCDESAGVCLDGCGHCACCQPPMAPSLAVVSLPVALSEREAALPARAQASRRGVRASPFRPPTAA